MEPKDEILAFEDWFEKGEMGGDFLSSVRKAFLAGVEWARKQAEAERDEERAANWKDK